MGAVHLDRLRRTGDRLLGVAVGVLLGICFVTGVTSHLIQHPPSRRLVRRAPEVWRWPLQLGLVVSGVLALARVPVLYGVGRDTQPGNASVLPGDSPRAVAGCSRWCGRVCSCWPPAVASAPGAGPCVAEPGAAVRR